MPRTAIPKNPTCIAVDKIKPSAINDIPIVKNALYSVQDFLVCFFLVFIQNKI